MIKIIIILISSFIFYYIFNKIYFRNHILDLFNFIINFFKRFNLYILKNLFFLFLFSINFSLCVENTNPGNNPGHNPYEIICLILSAYLFGYFLGYLNDKYQNNFESEHNSSIKLNSIKEMDFFQFLSSYEHNLILTGILILILILNFNYILLYFMFFNYIDAYVLKFLIFFILFYLFCILYMILGFFFSTLLLIWQLWRFW